MEIVQIAEIAHEANRVYCKSIGDGSQPHWEYAPDWAKDSAVNGVTAIRDGIVLKPSDSHESWLRQKEAEGWTYGKVKDPATKQHPCFVPYDQLPVDQQRKDEVFFNVVKALLALEF